MMEFAGAVATIASAIAGGTAMFAAATGLWTDSAEVGAAGILACSLTGAVCVAGVQAVRALRRR